MSERSQFTFYRSYYDSLKEMKNAEIGALVMAICAYALDGVETELKGAMKSMFCLIKPTLDVSARKAENGKRGGRPKANEKQTESKINRSESKAKANETKVKANESEGEKEKEKEYEVEVEKEVEVEYEKENENECLYNTTTPTPPPVNTEAAKTVRAYQNKLGSFLSATATRELIGFSDALGSELCTHALDSALDNGHREWSYIRAILSRYKEAGYTSIEQVINAENERKAQRVKPNQVVAKGMNWTADDMKQMLDALEGDL